MQATSIKKLDFVFNQLIERITTGYWKVGDKIPNEGVLATEFHCSRGTISKAIARLTHEGMVERRTRAGTRVTLSTAGCGHQALNLDALAFIYPSDQHEAIWRIVRGFQQAAHLSQQRTLMLSTGTDFRKEAEIVGRLGEFSVKGAAIYPVLPEPRDQVYYAQMILSCPFPVILVELNLPGVARPSVVVDGLHAGYTVTKHLLNQGLRKIGFLSNYIWAPFMRDRYLGYRQAMEEAGIPEEKKRVRLDSNMHPVFDNPLEDPTRIAAEYLAENSDIEGIVCGNDWFAHGCLIAASRANISVPNRLKIIGIDDFQSLPASTPLLTTYRIPYEKMGQIAFETLEAQIKDPCMPPIEKQLRGELIIRQSA